MHRRNYRRRLRIEAVDEPAVLECLNPVVVHEPGRVGPLGLGIGRRYLVQEGLHASGNGLVHFGRYTEMRIRQLHLLIERAIAEGERRAGDAT